MRRACARPACRAATHGPCMPGVVDAVRARFLKKLYFGIAADPSCTDILEVRRAWVAGAQHAAPRRRGRRSRGRDLMRCAAHAPGRAASHSAWGTCINVPTRATPALVPPPPPPHTHRSLCSPSSTAPTAARRRCGSTPRRAARRRRPSTTSAPRTAAAQWAGSVAWGCAASACVLVARGHAHRWCRAHGVWGMPCGRQLLGAPSLFHTPTRAAPNPHHPHSRHPSLPRDTRARRSASSTSRARSSASCARWWSCAARWRRCLRSATSSCASPTRRARAAQQALGAAAARPAPAAGRQRRLAWQLHAWRAAPRPDTPPPTPYRTMRPTSTSRPISRPRPRSRPTARSRRSPSP
jgi:hypothetical protein